MHTIGITVSAVTYTRSILYSCSVDTEACATATAQGSRTKTGVRSSKTRTTHRFDDFPRLDADGSTHSEPFLCTGQNFEVT